MDVHQVKNGLFIFLNCLFGHDFQFNYRICRNKRPPKVLIFQRGKYTKPMAFDGFWKFFYCFQKLSARGVYSSKYGTSLYITYMEVIVEIVAHFASGIWLLFISFWFKDTRYLHHLVLIDRYHEKQVRKQGTDFGTYLWLMVLYDRLRLSLRQMLQITTDLSFGNIVTVRVIKRTDTVSIDLPIHR